MTKFQLLSFGAAHKNGSEHALVAQPLHKTSILSQVQHGRASILDGADLTVVVPIFHPVPNARLRGWQRITLNSITTTITTAAQWDWKRHALTVPLEAFVSLRAKVT